MSEAPRLEFEVFTIFPEIVEAFVGAGLMAKARERDLVRVHTTNFRDFTSDKHRTVDDTPFGGGAGMVIKPEPVVAALESVEAQRGPMHRVLLTPSGPRFDQRAAERLARKPRIALLCGRYEGIDDRVREGWVDECLSIGDFVLNGGEVAAAVLIEAVARLREGVLGNPDSIAHESFAAPELEPEAESELGVASPFLGGQVLEHPHYTRPPSFRERGVPPVLLAGDHGKIEAWRRRLACLRTWALRPQLRPKPPLPPELPRLLAAPSPERAEDRAELEAIAARMGGEFLAVGTGPSELRDLKQIRKSLRRRHGSAPWILGVGPAQSPEARLRPRVIVDVLAHERRCAPGPLVFWLGPAQDPRGQPWRQGPDAWLALPDEDVRTNRDQWLAIDPGLIDISQPQAQARVSAPSLARRALAALREDAFLPDRE